MRQQYAEEVLTVVDRLATWAANGDSVCVAKAQTKLVAELWTLVTLVAVDKRREALR